VIEVERLERAESEQKEGMGEMEERERKMEQVGYGIDEKRRPASRESIGTVMYPGIVRAAD
jgi:hypothetical protein